MECGQNGSDNSMLVLFEPGVQESNSGYKRERLEEREIWDEDDEGVEAEDEVVSMFGPNLNKTPYELWKDRKPNIGYFKVFGCKCFVLNTKDNLGKFGPKSYVGIFLDYSSSRKAYRVYNKRTFVVEESMHVTFDESNPSSTEKVIVDDNAEEEQQEEFHALDLPAPEHHSDTLMVLAESDQIPTIIQIPRQIPRHELIKLMPLEWISNYEQFHNNTAPIQTSESMFERRQDGTVRMTFKPPPSAPQEPPRLSFTYSSMITAVQTAQEDLPITGFNSQGYPVYPAKHNGHFLWDAPGSGMCDPNCPCWDDWEEDDDYATTRKKKPKKKKPPVPCHHCDPKPPSDPPPPPAPLPIYRKELTWIAKHCKSEIPSPLSHPTPIVQPLACMMFSSTSSDYSSSFPPLEPHTDSQRNVVSKPFIPSPITSTGHLEPPKPFESVLNWHTQNARAQNDSLLHLNSKVENISLRTEQIETKVDSITAQMQQIHQNLHSRIGQLDSELRAMLAHRYNGPEFDQKEREIRRLKAELAQIESEKQRPTLFTSSPLIPSIGPTYHPFASMLSPIKQYDPSKLFGMTHTLFRDNPLPPPPKPKPKPRPQPRPPPLHPSSLTIPGQPSPTFTPPSPPAPLSVPAQSKDKEPMNQFTAHAVSHSSTNDQTSDSNLAVSDSHTETDSESSASTSDSEKSYADITKILMAQPDQGQTSHTEPYVDIPSEVEEEMPESSATNQPSPAQPNPPSQKSSNGPWFTFDDLPSHKWRDRLNEMSAWIDLQMLRTGATTQSVLREFATRFTGALRDWFDSLGQYRQLQFVDLPEVSSALAVLHDQFLGDPSAVFEAARRDYLNMKCCSLNAKDLDFHYKRMSLLFYKLNGFNEPTLKHVFLASLPEELQPDIQRQLTASNLSLDNISLGKIFQLAKTCLDKLCEQKQFFKELLKDKEPFRSACKKPYLQIKCHKKKDCDCSSKKKRHFRKFRTPEFSSKPRRSRKPYRFFRKKSSSSREFKQKQSSRCFICKKKGHYAKDCPNKREKAIRLVEHLQATTDYSPAKDELEFYFSEQDEPNDETVFALQNSSDSDSDQSQVIFHQQLLSLDTTVPIPSIKLQILPSKFQRPIPAIGLIDTGAQRSMLNPHILPPEYWTQSEEHFKAVNGKLFTTSLITKKSIGIQIFPNCVIWTKVIGSTLPNKDILLGFDILHQIKHLQIIPTGIRVKSMFKPFTNILKLYNLSETPQSYQDISTKLLSFCPESHFEFTHPNPLWKNKSFFIKLPFKLNEDINPTKATHLGMSPSDLLLAQQECSQLLAQGLIEPTSSQWACQAFYVEKHSEIVRGKKRLVIDYQPLNMFLQDDKFPLPRRQSMFTFLKNARIFSKFDLKSGFWQLGIEPSERYKTAFCIPNAHFQWTVLPFGLKTAPSIFQKSMVQIFQPILHHALIYIDDILLFSGSHEEHRHLLSQFYDIIQSHGIMLSAKKSTIATDNIEFLGMIIKDGHYQPGKHIAQELLHFPDQQLSKRQIQQFLGIINYIRDFLPHVDHHTHHLSALLKKKPPEWNADHTRAVTTLKQIAQNPPPLKLITDGKRILQTDASDESWGAILLEELNDKEHFIAYASGHFSETQQHYHSVFKEILAPTLSPTLFLLAFAHPHPLWKNPAHFVKLPFKLNEDLNPTKATHPGMPPSELQLAQTECAELLAQGLIEPTTSPWACQAFYVNKRAETLRGKKRLVIDYQPLNQFLQDDKFPLPRKNSIFTYLQNARIFSKFDLKSGFWQLGIDPAERYKTAFCIPNAHYQWTVLPFGLKTAPSIFQKAMTQIFQPLLHHTLVYIDDLLLFSGTPEEHQVLLQQFHDIIAHYGIMLSDKKSTIATDTVEYLGMQIKNGFYQPGPHIAQELLHFPDKDFTKKQVQQFLGIINYIRDFLPHVDQQTSILSALLKKNPISWDSRHTTAVQRLKQIAQNPPQLKIMTDGKRILQTDASDTSWGALLLEQIDKKEYLIGHASGHFSPAQQHYHTIYKEILAVKNGIKKFEYHLLGHRFLIRLDNSSFPKVLQFKGKTIPNSQLLRLQEWFSRYEFDVAHIKGQKNLIPDFLSRIQTPASPIFYTSPVFPIFMATRSTATSLPSKALTQKTFPRPVQTFPSLYRLQEFAKQFLFRYYMKAFFLEENPHNQFLTFHPENLFLTGFFIPSVRDISDDELWYFWCLTALHATQLIIPLAYTVNTLNNPSKATSLLWTLLEWFSPIPQWRSQLQQLSHNHHLSTIPSHEAEKFTSVFIVHRPYFCHPETAAFFAQPQISHYHTTPHPSTLDQDPMFKKALMNHLLSLNHVPPPPQDIISSSIGPRHDMFMVPNPSGSSKGIIIKEERPDTPPQIYYQDSQDPEDDFLPLSQLLQEFQTPPEQGQSSRVISQFEPIITHPPSQCRSLCIPGIVHAKGCPQYDGPTYLEQCTLFCEPHGANCHKSCVNYRRFESSSSSDDYGMNLSSP
ncbi:hypothetical protein KPL70_023296 [Citrus sinensis]|nr:hypothetical protein KPL70_023296 [Citrus sinensis]